MTENDKIIVFTEPVFQWDPIKSNPEFTFSNRNNKAILNGEKMSCG